MRLFTQLRQILVFVAAACALADVASAQSTGSLSGRIVDESGAAMPGVTVVVTNTGTGIARETTTNAQGLYNVQALQPGTYNLTVSLAGFAPQARNNITLVTGSDIAVEFTLSLATLAETVTVSGEAPLVETTQHDVSKSVQLSEVQSLPMLNRNFMGLVTLVPGARPAGNTNSNKFAFGGAISIGGGAGRSVEMKVDGLDNRDDVVGGTMFNFTLEGIQEFRVLAHDFGAQYGRTNGGVVIVTTRAGTNQFHGTGFGYGRNDSMTAIDHFTKAAGFNKQPYDRQQVGGSLGGPIKRDRMFFFGAVEYVRQNSVLAYTARAFQEITLLKQALMGLTECPDCMRVGNAIQPVQGAPQTLRDLTLTAKLDYQINQQHSLLARWAQQRLDGFDLNFGNHPDIGEGSNIFDIGRGHSIVGSHTWVIGNNAVNTVAVQVNHLGTSQICECGPAGPYWAVRNLAFPSFQTGVAQNGTDQIFYQDKVQFKEDFARQVGVHSLKIGGDYSFYPSIGFDLAGAGGVAQGQMSFFEDPSAILSNKARYPQGLLTPGAVRQITTGDIMMGGPPGSAETLGQKQFSAYIQDDWTLGNNLTLNLGVRYDLMLNAYNQKEYENSRTYRVLKAIGSPYAGLPQTAARDFSPRVGIAWDLSGDGSSVLRAGAGLFFDQMRMVNNFQRALQEKPTLANISSVFVNTAVGAGAVASYVYGISPLPPSPLPGATELRPGASTVGAWFDPEIGNPYNRTYHVGYSRQLTSRSALSIDYTHIDGRKEWAQVEANPVEGAWDPNAASYNTCGAAPGYRRLQCAFQTVLGDPRILGQVFIADSRIRTRFDELIVHLENRQAVATFQASYTLAGAFAYGGVIGSPTISTNPASPVNLNDRFADTEWGPSSTDERHRVVLSAVLNLPWGIQASPILQAASARPYNLTAGRDLNGDGINNDRFVDPSTGQMVSFNAARGKPTFNFDTRVTKMFRFGEARTLGVFAELYNLTNRANFGNAYNGNSLSAVFRQPTGFVNSGLTYPTSRQLQLGARFTF